MNINELQHEALDILKNNILPYWMNKMVDHENGGFYGCITGKEDLIALADKGGVLNARILWTFSATYRVLGDKEYLDIARRAKDYLLQYFYDSECGGIYWSLDCKGSPKDAKKQTYAIGFAIYGLSEYYRATGEQEALDVAIELFDTIEKYSFDAVDNGYFEAFTRDWQEIEDMRLSEKDANERKTMNTHLHILEPYTNLYRAWKDERLAKQLRNLILLFTDKIMEQSTGHLQLFFDDKWTCKARILSYGHDIEASWLIHEAALVLGDATLIDYVTPFVKKIADAASEGFSLDRGMYYEKNLETEHLDCDRHWWVQAEAVVGFLNLYRHFNNEDALKKSTACWSFIKQHLIDYKNGEWYWSLKADDTINTDDDKAGLWKCPYHNGRMCLEVIDGDLNRKD